ncbi:MBL fold metallo-hydrolase [Pararhizobium sp. IMCC21322]|uniref:MBL fold metallo-hydrolase n=1 Tax=Pararhizobium sp. IMCC21322 TaxID=3067903 RepID=UPI002740B739|nr:MBL fold metallo-hydrolase [Pararhizobium sp. IMCC21322]
MRIEENICWPSPGSAGLVWLGQAGFWIETGQHRILVDPYLSDSLAQKYKGEPNEHQRMMPPPCRIEDVPRPDIILITHAHTDHMDPDTLAPLCTRYPDVPFVVPISRFEEAQSRIGKSAKLIGVDADETITPIDGLTLTVFPAAHEERTYDDNGRDVFLGFGIESDGLKILHPGDTIPFPGLFERISKFAPDIALLPVNGRDKTRLAQGIPGNMSLAEAIELGRNIAVIIPHHWGMFSFNTIDPELIVVAANECTTLQIVLPVCGKLLRIHPADAENRLRVSMEVSRSKT